MSSSSAAITLRVGVLCSVLMGGRATEFAAGADVTSQEQPSEHPEMLGDNGVVELDLIGGSAKHHAAGIDDDDVVGKIEGELDVLLDEHDRLPLRLELRNRAANLGDELRRESLGGLIHQQHARIAHQRAADCQHLLLAAGE